MKSMKSLKLKVDERLYRQVQEICQAAGIAREDLIETFFRQAVVGAAKGASGLSSPKYLFPEMEEDWTREALEGTGEGGIASSLNAEAVCAYARELAKAFETNASHAPGV